MYTLYLPTVCIVPFYLANVCKMLSTCAFLSHEPFQVVQQTCQLIDHLDPQCPAAAWNRRTSSSNCHFLLTWVFGSSFGTHLLHQLCHLCHTLWEIVLHALYCLAQVVRHLMNILASSQDLSSTCSTLWASPLRQVELVSYLSDGMLISYSIYHRKSITFCTIGTLSVPPPVPAISSRPLSLNSCMNILNCGLVSLRCFWNVLWCISKRSILVVPILMISWVVLSLAKPDIIDRWDWHPKTVRGSYCDTSIGLLQQKRKK